MRKVLITTSTRADWGLLSPVARALDARPDVRVVVMATNMHLDPSRGNTLDEIRADGFEPLIVPMPTLYDTPATAARAMTLGANSAVNVMEHEAPDLLLVLGDRFETLGFVAAANVMRIPVVHLHGGEITEGAFDDNFRHATTKLAALHITATEQYRRRVIQMGEEPRRVICAGALGVANLAGPADMTRAELEADLGWSFDRPTLLVTLHPATLSGVPTAQSVAHLLEALDRFPHTGVIFTAPNNDPEGEVIIRSITEYVAANPGRCLLVPSLGRRRYHAALKAVKAVVGNSSSGILEVPSAGIPTVDIGVRQKGRIAAESVIHADDSTEAIAEAIARALAMDCSAVTNPYWRPDTVDTVVSAIADTPMELLRAPKRFYDIEYPLP